MQKRWMPSAQSIHAELARVIDSDAMRRSPCHMRLLYYLVERCLAGDRAALSEAAIAVAVFRRDPASYDPHVDPIVRVTMRRLRGRLSEYYATTPATIRIFLPPRSYAPAFVRDADIAFTAQ